MPLNGMFDLGILANMDVTAHAAKFCKRTICVSHGIIPAEIPGRADETLFVSEGVKKHWGREGGIIRQPIDLSLWRDRGRRRSRVVRYSYRQYPMHCEAAAEALGRPYRHVRDASAEKAAEELSAASVVFASGRAALEAMACGAPVVIYDHRGAYQGPLMDNDLWRQMGNSYSGRGGVNPSLDEVIEAAKEATPNRAWVEEHHDVKTIVKAFL
jgi:hypothetical protein